MTRPPYVENAVLVPGRVAAVYDRILRSPRVAAVLAQLADPDEQAVRAALHHAAKRHGQASRVERNGETATGPAAALLPYEISTSEAAEVLGVTRRRVQQLAAAGLGRRDAAGRWRLDAAAVLALANHRRCA